MREQKLDGIVMFANDSNTHTLESFGEIQPKKWMSELFVGIIVHPSHLEIIGMQEFEGKKIELEEVERENNLLLPI